MDQAYGFKFLTLGFESRFFGCPTLCAPQQRVGAFDLFLAYLLVCGQSRLFITKSPPFQKTEGWGTLKFKFDGELSG
jgi:hypothetical protein